MDDKNILRPESILIVDDDSDIQLFVKIILTKGGFDVTVAGNGKEALQRISEATPDLIISDVMMPEMDGFSLLKELRSKSETAFIPLILLTTRNTNEDIIDGLNLGADDYLSKPFDANILLARVKSKLSRPPVPVENLILDRKTGLQSTQKFISEATREIFRSSKGGKPGCLAFLEILETPRYRERLGERADSEISKQISEIIQRNSQSLDIFGHGPSGKFLILLPERDNFASQRYLKEILLKISEYNFVTHFEAIRLTPAIGYTIFENNMTYAEVSEKTEIALEYARSQMDLEPKIYNEEARRVTEKIRKSESAKKQISKLTILYANVRSSIQFIVSLLLYLLIPFIVYVMLDKLGANITPYVYYVVVIALLITAIMIWVEGVTIP
jgi:CheY-like chemotaxis protein